MGASPYSTEYLRDQITAVSRELDREAQKLLELQSQASGGWQTDKCERKMKERSVVKDSLLKKLAAAMNSLSSTHEVA